MVNQQASTAMKDMQGYFREGERQKIYRSCDLVRDKVLIRLLWKSGRRISEVLNIKGKDIDIQNGMIFWTILKKKKPTTAWKPIDTKTLQLLNYYMIKGNIGNDDFLLHGGYPSKHISRQRADTILQRLCKKAGVLSVGGARPHCHHFRHTFAIDLIRRCKTGSGIRIVQQALEHSSLNMTEQYLQFSPEELRDLIEDEEPTQPITMEPITLAQKLGFDD